MSVLDRPTDRDLADWMTEITAVQQSASQVLARLQVLRQVTAERIDTAEEEAKLAVRTANAVLERLALAARRPQAELPKVVEEKLRTLRDDLLDDAATTGLSAVDVINSLLAEYGGEG